jgi:hypothetical protein
VGEGGGIGCGAHAGKSISPMTINHRLMYISAASF